MTPTSPTHRRMKFACPLAALAVVLTSCSTRIATRNFSGDGNIRPLSGGAVIGGGGYEVQFAPFQLDRPKHMTYRFSGLPKIHSSYEVDFAIAGPQNWVERWYFERRKGDPTFLAHHPKMIIDDLRGHMKVILRDSKGHVLFSVNHPLSEYGWHSTSEGLSTLYDKDWKMKFTAEEGVEYTIDVEITPDASLRVNRGNVRIYGGGHEGWAIGF